MVGKEGGVEDEAGASVSCGKDLGGHINRSHQKSKFGVNILYFVTFKMHIFFSVNIFKIRLSPTNEGPFQSLAGSKS